MSVYFITTDMKHRSRLEIISLILDIATRRDGVTQKKILYRAYLSYQHLKEYLSMLQENGLIKYQEETRLYRTTEKGLHFLSLYGSLNDVVTMTNNIIIR
ncbi:MAG TPA: winged helix-turn-helix domain-containing protein [Nitrososphaeraceae archaeon]|nr:winged helix-turn-helix domain-containing protein [Nitrososphaeraceae archaeon]